MIHFGVAYCSTLNALQYFAINYGNTVIICSVLHCRDLERERNDWHATLSDVLSEF